MEKNNAPSVVATDQKKPEQNPAMDYFSNLDFSKLEVRIEDMFKSGVHFGHHKSRKNPKMNGYIFTTKNSINIFDLEKTKAKLEEALEFISQTIAEGKEILFVGTKKQAKKIVEAAAVTCEMPFVTERWLGGTFTNFSVISGRTRYLREGLEKMKKGEYAKYTKFEQMKKTEELERMERKMGGIKNMMKLPGAVFVASVCEDKLAVKESRFKDIPVIALVDSNMSPDGVDYPIPANEDAVAALKLLLSYAAAAVIRGKNAAQKIAVEKTEEKTEAKK